MSNKKVLIATPMYGGLCHGEYTKSILNLSKEAENRGIEIETLFSYNASLISLGRNSMANKFINGRYDYLFFIDADISFDSKDFFKFIELAEEREDMDVLCAPYPHKSMNWHRLAYALQIGAIKDVSEFEKYLPGYSVTLLEDLENTDLSGKPFEIKHGGTAFMLIKNKTFKKVVDFFPENFYFEYLTNQKTYDFFKCHIEKDEKRYLTEDYGFCELVRESGGKIWFVPEARLKHHGSYTYTGSFMETASVDLKQLRAQRSGQIKI
jgi:hypothetical protein